MDDSVISIEGREKVYDNGTISFRNVVRSVYKLQLSPENLQKLWDKCKFLDTVFGFEVKYSLQLFLNTLFKINAAGDYETDQLLFVIDDFVGIFRVSDIRYPDDAQVHYIFFDGRSNGRHKLVLKMAEYLFDSYKFDRLSVELPNYVLPATRHFVTDLGFTYEGKKRSACSYRGKKFDINLYSLLPSDLKHNPKCKLILSSEVIEETSSREENGSTKD